MIASLTGSFLAVNPPANHKLRVWVAFHRLMCNDIEDTFESWLRCCNVNIVIHICQYMIDSSIFFVLFLLRRRYLKPIIISEK